MNKVTLVSLGCAKNLVDSEVMLGHLVKAGYSIATDSSDTDVIVVNTCGFIKPARQESRKALVNAIEAKRKGRAKKVIAAGCYVQRNQQELVREFPEVDAWIGVNDFDKIAMAADAIAFQSSPDCFLYDHRSPRILSTPPSWAYLKISEGCSHRCSYCAIPHIKGRYRSRSIASIVEEAQRLASGGVREINLVSHDSTYFGREIGLRDGLVQLLRELIRVDRVEWIRVLYAYPEEISSPLLEIMHENKICSYLDIPFQHSDPALVKKMRRSLDGGSALKLIHKIRNQLPDVALRTSLIVGFPGEGEKEFRNLIDFVSSAEFDHLGVFTYSPEEGTQCFSLGNPINEALKQRRRNKILEVQAEISYRNCAKYIGRKEAVLIEGHLKQKPSILLGRTRYQAPEVDGVVFIEEGKSHPAVIGEIAVVEITARDIYDLYGRIAP
jgi:ribosomal protein S12 methylthiotransferase